jgi:hypothetical protein
MRRAFVATEPHIFGLALMMEIYREGHEYAEVRAEKKPPAKREGLVKAAEKGLIIPAEHMLESRLQRGLTRTAHRSATSLLRARPVSVLVGRRPDSPFHFTHGESARRVC